ncbi:MAG: hypothetical protein SGI77_21600 [Pirellulaceae bacterium]|nr:hypothetical protein [Pirellulaceae bacterium]
MATTLTPGSIVTGALDLASETDTYRFAATAGSRYYFDSQTLAAQNAQWRLQDPLGRTVASAYLGTDMEPATLSMTGQYTLLIEGYPFDSGTIDYTFLVQPVVDAAPVALNVGSTVAGNISVAGERDRYSFTLGASSRLLFDALVKTGAMVWSLEGPSGVIVTNRNLESDSLYWSGIDPVLDLIAGNYQLTIDGSGDVTGPYSFRFSNLNSATPLTPGALVSGVIDPANEADIYRFTANVGERFYFDTRTTLPQNTAWRLISPIGTTLFSSQLGADVEPAPFTIAGQYALLIEGYFYETVTTNYSFVVQPAFDVAPTALTLGATTNGDISVPGENDRFSFTLGANNRLSFDALVTAGSIVWSLTGPAGIIDADRQLQNDTYINNSTPILDLIAGAYVLTIEGADGAMGGYSFRLLDLFAATVVTPGTLVTAVLDPANATNAYRFTASAGNSFYFDAQALGGLQNASWVLLDPLGRNTTMNYLGSDMEPAAFTISGTYTLLVQGHFYDTSTIDYSFVIHPVVDATPQAIAFDATISSSIAVPGEQDRFTFTVPVDGHVYFDVLEAAVSGSGRLKGPGFDQTFPLADALVWNLVPGSYELIIDGIGDAIGAYSFRCLNLGVATPLIPGNPVVGTLSPASETDFFSFLANAGDRFSFVAATTDPQSASWRLLDPLGRNVFSTNLGSDVIDVDFAMSGMYTLLIEGHLTDTGTTSYGFTANFLSNTPPIPFPGTPLTFEATVTSDISVAGEQDQYIFTLASNSRLLFDALLTPVGIAWSLEGPAGFAVSSRQFEYDTRYNWGTNPAIDLIPGNYQLTIDGNGDAIGDYSFRLLDLGAATPLALGALVTDSLNPANETKAYRFTAAAGDRIYFDAQPPGSVQNAGWTLLNPFGNAIFSSSLASDVEPAPLPFTGQYTLILEGYYYDTGFVDYSFRVQSVDTKPADSVLSPNSIPENQPNLSVVGLFTTSDVDSSSVQSYSLVSGIGSTDNAAFTIDGHQLKTVASFNFEAKSTYSIRVRTIDNIGLLFEKVFTVNVTNVNETPTNILLSNSSLPENAGANAVIGVLSAIDQDFSETFTFNLPVGLSNNSLFNISGTSLRANASFNFEVQSSYTVTVRVTDAGGLTFDKVFTINITDVPDSGTVDNRRVFYNRSSSTAFGDGSGNPINAIDSTKTALMPGQTSSFANYSNYVRGLNGLLVDISNLGGPVTTSDFVFSVWNGISGGGFGTLTASPTISVISGGGLGGSSRIKIEFGDNVIRDTWLRVTVLANTNTGLSLNDVFYFGNAVGDVNVGNAMTSPVTVQSTLSDYMAVRQNLSGGANSVGVTNIYDLNKDGRVNPLDMSIVQQNQRSRIIRHFIAPVSLQLSPTTQSLLSAQLSTPLIGNVLAFSLTSGSTFSISSQSSRRIPPITIDTEKGSQSNGTPLEIQSRSSQSVGESQRRESHEATTLEATVDRYFASL